MQLRNLLVLFLLCCFIACKHTSSKTKEKFDKTKWAIKNDEEYPHRDNMLKDFIGSYKLNGLKKDTVINLLGLPDRTDNGFLYYNISKVTFANLPVPLHTKTLVIKLSKDSTIEWRKIHE